MIIHSDWHIHSEYSYDATLSLEEIAAMYGVSAASVAEIIDELEQNGYVFKTYQDINDFEE